MLDVYFIYIYIDCAVMDGWRERERGGCGGKNVDFEWSELWMEGLKVSTIKYNNDTGDML